jgi:hypothetical protein
LCPQEPWHGPDRREADGRILGVEVVLKSREAALYQVGVENLIANPVERVEPSEPFFGIFLLFAVNRLLVGDGPVVDIFLIEQNLANRRQLLLELDPLGLACVRAKHTPREASETAGHFQSVGDGETGREFELL